MSTDTTAGPPLSAAKQALLDRWVRRAGAAPGGPAPDPDAVRPRPAGTPAPVSFTQERLWFLERLGTSGAAYHAPLGLRLHGELDVAALRLALRDVVERHEVLRTTFDEVGGGPVLRLRVLGPGEPAVPMTDLTGRPDELAAAVHHEVTTPMPLSTGPLVRGRLFRLAPTKHLFVLTWHHAVADAWSGGVVGRELAQAYRARRRGQDPRLAPLPVQYGDYAAWQRRHLTGPRLDGLLAYWRRQLDGAPPALDLPVDRPRPAVQDVAGDTVDLTVPAAVTARLEALARDCGASLFMVVLAAFDTLLLRHSGQTDLCVGVPVAGRTRPEIEPLVGFFAGTVVMRTDCGGDPTFRELVARVREVAAGAYGHQELPFEKLVEALHPVRDPARHPLFQVLLTWQTGEMATFALDGLRVEPEPLPTGTAKFDLQLGVVHGADGLAATLEFATALFDRATVERMAGHLRVLLEAVAADADVRLSALPLLTPAERTELVLTRNRTGVPFPTEQGVHELVAAVAAAEPDRPAVDCAGRSVTYAELDALAASVAARLRRRGIGPGTVVGVCVPRSVELVAALLGVWKAGAAYVALDPDHPDERLAFVLDETAAPVVLVHGTAREPFAAAGRTVLDVGRPGPGGDPVPPAGSSGPAYVLYTSGSTGRPKGVAVSHRSVVSLLVGTRERLGITADDTVLAVSTVCFDIAVAELWMPLITGARVVVAAEDEARDGARLAALAASCGATVLDATPATWRMLLAAGWPGDDGLTAISTGEALPADLAAQLAQRSGETWNLYGPTECTVWATGWRVDPARPGPVPIGRAWANTRVYVVDGAGALVPRGVPGELWIGGDGVALGYVGRGAVTAERFVPDPFGPVPGARLYRTGDVVRWASDGLLEFIGRVDRQVKVRGYRIELGEIEEALRGRAGVADVAVQLEGTDDAPLIVAYVVPVAGHAPSGPDLHREASRLLPSYMVPSRFTTLDAFPLNGNGKLDRAALAGTAGQALALAAFRAPQTRTAQLIARTWQDLLGTERVGLHDNFFDLGGHSLLALRAQRLLEAELDRVIPVVALFRHPTVSALADHLDGAGPRATAAVADRAERSRTVGALRRRRSDSRTRPAADHGNADDTRRTS